MAARGGGGNDGKEEETAKKKRNVNRADVYLLPVERRDATVAETGRH